MSTIRKPPKVKLSKEVIDRLRRSEMMAEMEDRGVPAPANWRAGKGFPQA